MSPTPKLKDKSDCVARDMADHYTNYTKYVFFYYTAYTYNAI